MLPVAWLQLFHLLGESWCVVLVMVAVLVQWAHDHGLSVSVPASVFVTFLQVAGGNRRRRLAMDPLAGGTEEGLLGEKFFGMFTNVFFFFLWFELFQRGSVCV